MWSTTMRHGMRTPSSPAPPHTQSHRIYHRNAPGNESPATSSRPVWCPKPRRPSMIPAAGAAPLEAQSMENSQQHASKPLVEQAEVTFKPAYNKYLTRAEIRQTKIRYWRRILYADTPQAAITAWSLLLWIPRFIKYEVVPVQLRYVVWLLLQPLQGLQKQLHRQLVLRGAALDAALTRGTFSRARVLRRWHGTQSTVDDVVYRGRLLMGQR